MLVPKMVASNGWHYNCITVDRRKKVVACRKVICINSLPLAGKTRKGDWHNLSSHKVISSIIEVDR